MEKTKLMEILRNYNRFGFHLSRKSWEWLQMPELMKAPISSSPASEVYLLRQLTDRINEKRAQGVQNPVPIHAGQLASVSVLIDIFRYIVEIYGHEEQPGVIPRGIDWTKSRHDQYTVTKPPASFVGLFPPVSVLKGDQSEAEYLQSLAGNSLTSETIVREIVLLFISSGNPAFKPFRMLFDDADLRSGSPYVPMVNGLEEFFAKQPPFKPVGLTLFECLRAPILASAESLEGQLKYIQYHWQHFLPLDLLERLLLAIDVLEEERILRGLGPGPIEALRFDRDSYGLDLGYAEPAAFSRDADWMSNVVLIAKSIYVWLFQLSNKYKREMRLLSDVPDEELDQLARWGFTGLWLIGLWERSSASRKIKEIMGNPEAASSAYSLYDYVIAHDLGGDEAFQNLRQRAWQRGIRLASDMVPNHMGIYSRWVIEHPQWFLQSSYPPFPVYQYNGVDLSEEQRVCIQIEDGYWQHRDAAVVFKRIDKWTGDVRYIYHGNDGTSMPWNDTAQLNFLLPEVREAVIQTILHVARKFPIIRFDAAMTLAKRHYQRLWFPQPGEGGAIPSRAEHGMTRQEFDAHMPKEFWREVVDRVAQELPDTLLLAEAFWLMEGYFVRTLGMHRVYNSAFMNMLKMEDNAKYRTTVKNVLEFSPEVLKRLVNFMNNPDERTAVDQFGRDDKYYGVAMLMVTMPGLPMFGHGQIEGFAEKYGMEYRRSYWDEQVDQTMVYRHETQIFPLMRRRRLFSGAANFAFYDFFVPEGWVDENVMAYSNRAGDERAIILYNNAYSTTKGTIRSSTQINVGDSDKPVFVRKNLAEALGLNTSDDCFYIFRDYRSGLEHIRFARQLAEQGLYAELQAYQYHAFLDFREIHDYDGSWRELERRLNGAGVPSIDEAYQEFKLEPILKPYRELMNPGILIKLSADKPVSREELSPLANNFYTAIKYYIGASTDIQPLGQRFMTGLNILLKSMEIQDGAGRKAKFHKAGEAAKSPTVPGLDHIAFAWLTVYDLGSIRPDRDQTPAHILAITRLDQWLLKKIIREAFDGFWANSDYAYWDSRLVGILLSHHELLDNSGDGSLGESIRRILLDSSVREYLQVNRYNDAVWLNKERLERMIATFDLVARISAADEQPASKTDLSNIQKRLQRVLMAAGQAGYQVEKMVMLLE